MEKRTRKWTKFEKIWIWLFSIIILGTTIGFNLMFGTDWANAEAVFLNWILTPISALTGIFCVVLVAKTNIRNYAWGLINCLAYGYVAYKVGYYGDMMLNFFFFLPFQFIGYWAWKKRLKPESKTDITVRKLNAKQWLVLILGGGAVLVAFGLILNGVDSWFTTAMRRNESIYTYINDLTGVPLFGPMFDSSTEIFQIVAQFLMTWGFVEQWPLWAINNIITIAMWTVVGFADPTLAPMAIVTAIMWVAYLVNSIYGWVVWNREAKLNK